VKVATAADVEGVAGVRSSNVRTVDRLVKGHNALVGPRTLMLPAAACLLFDGDMSHSLFSSGAHCWASRPSTASDAGAECEATYQTQSTDSHCSEQIQRQQERAAVSAETVERAMM
jgi:hypothetical protein